MREIRATVPICYGEIDGRHDFVCGWVDTRDDAAAMADDPGEGGATPSLEHEGETVHFCCEGCRAEFELALLFRRIATVETDAEVGRVEVVGTESKGKGNKRIRIEVLDA